LLCSSTNDRPRKCFRVSLNGESNKVVYIDSTFTCWHVSCLIVVVFGDDWCSMINKRETNRKLNFLIRYQNSVPSSSDF
jgi:hypothetical protein